ncbi:hypothetical protein [Nostoc sp.]|uniref:hypothetical protein n=1 Tax=Nostoc sp. TaxID=1180 RepID=UPI002FF70274
MTDNGIAVFSLNAVAQMAGVSRAAISKAFKNVNQSPSKLAETLIQQGIKSVNLERYGLTGVPDTAVAHILFYYAAEAGRYCTVDARNWVKTYTSVGLRAYVHNALGYSSQTQSSTIVHQCPIEREIKAIDEHKIAVQQEIDVHKRTITRLEDEYDDLNIRQAGLYIQKYEPIAKRIQECEDVIANGIGKNSKKHLS